MRKALKVGLIALPWVLSAVLFYLWADSWFSDVWRASTDDHSIARNAFYRDLAFEGCVPREAVIAEAEDREWPWEAIEFHWCHRPNTLTGWLRVEVSPPLPFSTQDENSAFIGFDDNGCMANWTYASC